MKLRFFGASIAAMHVNKKHGGRDTKRSDQQRAGLGSLPAIF